MAIRNGFILLTLSLCFSIFSLLAVGATTVTTANGPLPTASEGLNCSQTVDGSTVSQCYFSLINIPECGRECMKNVTLMTPCESTDFKCLCAHSAEIQRNGVGCLKDACEMPDVQMIINYYFRLCKSANYPLSEIPSSTSALSSMAAATVYTTAPPTTSSTTSQDHKGSPSLSTAVKAGIGIGATLGGLVLVLLLGLYLVRRRDMRRRKLPRRNLDVLETTQFKPQRYLGRGEERRKTHPHPYQKGPIELPSEPALVKRQDTGGSEESMILPRSPSDEPLHVEERRTGDSLEKMILPRSPSDRNNFF